MKNLHTNVSEGQRDLIKKTCILDFYICGGHGLKNGRSLWVKNIRPTHIHNHFNDSLLRHLTVFTLRCTRDVTKQRYINKRIMMSTMESELTYRHGIDTSNTHRLFIVDLVMNIHKTRGCII